MKQVLPKFCKPQTPRVYRGVNEVVLKAGGGGGVTEEVESLLNPLANTLEVEDTEEEESPCLKASEGNLPHSFSSTAMLYSPPASPSVASSSSDVKSVLVLDNRLTGMVDCVVISVVVRGSFRIQV